MCTIGEFSKALDLTPNDVIMPFNGGYSDENEDIDADKHNTPKVAFYPSGSTYFFFYVLRMSTQYLYVLQVPHFILGYICLCQHRPVASTRMGNMPSRRSTHGRTALPSIEE